VARLSALIVMLLGVNTLFAPLLAKEALLQTTANPAIKQGYVDTDNGQLHYWVAGAGPALLLIHQASSSVEEFAGMVPYLADRYRLIAFDWPGHGGSDDPVKEFGVDDFTQSALAVLDHLAVQNTHVLGNHGGALIAMNLTWKHPERVNKLILSGTSGVKKRTEIDAFTDSLDIEKRNKLDRQGKSLSDAWQRYLAYMPHSTPEEILVSYLNNVNTRLRPYDAHYGVLRWDRQPALASFKDRRILLMQGENDQFVSRQETLLALLPNSERSVLKDAGVFMFFEKPAAAAKMIADFLVK